MDGRKMVNYGAHGNIKEVGLLPPAGAQTCHQVSP